MIINFIRWFKQSLEDEKGTASFRRIYNYILISLVAFVVIYFSVKERWSMLIIYVLIILLVAGFLNIGVITTDNILRFFNRDKDTPDPAPQPQQPVQQHVEGNLNVEPVINPNPQPNQPQQ